MSVPLQSIAGFDPQKRELLSLLLARQGIDPGRAPIVPQARRAGGLAVSFAQERLWFIDRLAPGGSAYNLPVALRLTGELAPSLVARIFSEIVRRHEILRTTFDEAEGRPVQVVAPAAPVTLPQIDLGALAAAAREDEAERLATAEARRPFDLARGPVLRLALVRLDAGEQVLLATMHHIASDGWSARVLISEVAALYEAFGRGLPSPLPELPIQYADFASWQRQWLQGAVLDAELAYWRQQLPAGRPPTELPTDRPRPAVQSTRGRSRLASLPALLVEGLRELGHRQGATLFMTLLTGILALLNRVTGQEDLTIGTPIAGRNRAELEKLIGCFVNTLALRAVLDAGRTFGENLAAVRQAAVGAFSHQELPFEKLVAELKPERDLGRTPLFQVMFVLQNTRVPALTLPGLDLEPLPVESRTAAFDLTVRLVETASGVESVWEHRSDLFDPATIVRLQRQLERLLAGAVAEPGRRLAGLPLLSAAERHHLVLEWAGSGKERRTERCLHRLFEERAARRPAATALICGELRLSYGDLDRLADRLAHRLRGLGVGPEARVGLCAERSAEVVVGILGILKAGGAYVPLDPAYPAERLAFVVADAGVRVLVAGPGAEAAAAALAEAAPQLAVVRLGVGEEDLADEGPPALPGGAVADNLAYAIYTSGSTGRPKGVLVSHRQVVRLLTATAPWFAFGEDDVWTLFHSHAFDFSVWEIWGALAFGGRLVVVPHWASRSPEELGDLLRRERVTVLNQTPSAFRGLMQCEAARPLDAAPLALRWVIFGGEALELQSLAPWFERHGEAPPRLVNMYGITETTVHVTFRPLARHDTERAGSAIGVPIPDLRVWLLDRALEPVPIGVPGELCVGGAGLARGYLGRPELTAGRFVPDALSGWPGARLYRSGDLARYRADGELEYLGRIDQQVKVRGFRIEPGEIEAALLAHPAVATAAVVARDDGGGTRLVAYLVAGPDGAPSVTELKAFLARRLPEHMVPAAFVALAALPLTPNGKLDRRALPAPGGDRPELARAYLPPRTPAEEQLAAIWCELLGLERVGALDNFFELGGHSLLATQLMTRIRRGFGVELPIRSLFEAPDLAALAELVLAGRFEQEDGGDLARLMAELEDLPEEEALRLLGETGMAGEAGP